MLSGRPLLFLGCSLNQDRTIGVLKEVSTNSPFIAHYAIVEQPFSVEHFHERSRFLSNHNIRPIWYPNQRHDFIEPLLAHLLKTSTSQHLLTMPQQNVNSLDNHYVQYPTTEDKTAAERFQAIFHEIEKAEIKDDLRELLKQLASAVHTMIKELPKEKAEEGVDDMEKLVDFANLENPNPKWYRISRDGLIAAAENLGKIGEPVIELMSKVTKLLTGGML
jgi:hypothetical protein